MHKYLIKIIIIIFILFGLTVPLVSQEEYIDCPYFSGMPNYLLIDSLDREFDAHNFFDGKGDTTVEGRLWIRYYSVKEGALTASALQICRNYSTALKSSSGLVFNNGECTSEESDHYGMYFVSGKMTKGRKEVWLEVLPDGGGEEYTMTVIERPIFKLKPTVPRLNTIP